MENSGSLCRVSPLTRTRVPAVVRAVAMAALLAAGSGCSSHDSNIGDKDGGASGRSSAGRGGGGGTSGTAAAGYVKCGSKQCGPPGNILPALPIQTDIPVPVACCLSEATGQCGSRPTAGAMCEPPAVPDPRCPGVDFGALAALAGGAAGSTNTMTGCCAPDNECGLDGTIFGRGCVENSAAATLLSSIPLLGGLVVVPASRACDAPPPEPEPDPEADGGAEDAG